MGWACIAAGIAAGTVVLAASQDQHPLPRGSEPARPPGAAETERTARLVRIDAIVTDRQGRPILNLAPGDFQIVENGVAQKIDAVELRAVKAVATGAVHPIATEADEARAAREPGTRVIGLLLDEFHVSRGEASDRVREALTRFVDEDIRPGDLLAVVKPLDTVTAIRFTRDREAVRRAITEFQGRRGDFTPRTDFEKKYMGSAPSAVQAGRAQIVMAALRSMMMKLGDLEAGRAAILLVSEGFGAPAVRDRERRVPDVQGLIRAASRFNVAVYTLNPRASDSSDATTEAADEAALDTIAAQTGGETMGPAGGLRSGLTRLVRDLDAYYLVSYTSSHPSDGRFYDVKIRTSRRDAQVRARSGYWAPLRTELLRDHAERRMVPMRALRRSPLIQTWLGLTVDSEGAQRVTFTWEPASDAPRGSPRPTSIAVKIASPAGAVLFDGEIAAPRAPVRAGRMEAAVFTAPPGRIQLDLVIFGGDGTPIDTAAHDLDVPDASRADPLILPPQVFRTFSAREFREVVADSGAAPVPGRTFRRTERLLLRVPAHSPSGASIELTARLVNRRGQVLREIDRLPGAAAPGITQFDVPLAPFAPGEYTIELTATSRAGTAREVIRFRLTG